MDPASRLGCDPAALAAVLQVESGKYRHGRPTIRFEVHVFWRSVKDSGGDTAAVDAVFRVTGPEPWEGHEMLLDGQWLDGQWRRIHTGLQDLEWTALELARAIDPVAAVEATSWGLGQVLGRNWERLKYSSAAEFEAAMATREGQLEAVVRYIEADPVLLQALRVMDWPAFARRYNGPGQVARYAGLLEAAYRAAA